MMTPFKMKFLSKQLQWTETLCSQVFKEQLSHSTGRLVSHEVLGGLATIIKYMHAITLFPNYIVNNDTWQKSWV